MAPEYGIAVSLYLGPNVALRTRLTSSSVIHPKSKAIEGTLIYMGPQLLWPYAWTTRTSSSAPVPSGGDNLRPVSVTTGITLSF